MVTRFLNRALAGRSLAAELVAYAHHPDVVVLGLPRGGVPVAWEVAQALSAPLDICLVRKLGTPAHPEIAMGAIAAGGIRVLNHDVIKWLGISDREIDEVSEIELKELQRRRVAYRDGRPVLNVRDRIVMIVDDGLATGSTMKAAIALLKPQQPQQIIVAVPVAPAQVCQDLQKQVDRVICLSNPEPFYAIGFWYKDFTQVTDDEVRRLLTTVCEV
jgi:putative phosphoribosyl transferase